MLYMLTNLKSIITASIAGLVISGNWLFIKPAHANLFLSPMYLQLESQQGQSKGVLQVGNTSSEPIRVRLSATAFTYDKNGNFQSLDRGGERDLTPYIRYSPKEIVIPANSSRRVRVLSLLPPSLPEGEYRTAIFAETLQETTNAKGYKFGLNFKIGSALYVAKGDLNSDISFKSASFDSVNHLLKMLVINQGNATAKGEIVWTLKKGDIQVASGKSGGSFLPQTQTDISLNRPQKETKLDLAPGVYQLTGEMVWDSLGGQKKHDFQIEVKI
jgi:hypothetical protein